MLLLDAQDINTSTHQSVGDSSCLRLCVMYSSVCCSL